MVDFSDNEEVFDNQTGLGDYQLIRDRERRDRKAPTRYGFADLISFSLLVAEDLDDSEPKSYKEAVSSKNRKLWLDAMKEEMHSLEKNQTWTLVNKPANQKIVGCKWVYKTKRKCS